MTDGLRLAKYPIQVDIIIALGFLELVPVFIDHKLAKSLFGK